MGEVPPTRKALSNFGIKMVRFDLLCPGGDHFLCNHFLCNHLHAPRRPRSHLEGTAKSEKNLARSQPCPPKVDAIGLSPRAAYCCELRRFRARSRTSRNRHNIAYITATKGAREMQRTTRTWVSPYLHPHLFECPTGEHAQRAPVGAQHGSSLFWTFRHHRDGPRKVVRTFSY